jgi:hypothetical protein
VTIFTTIKLLAAHEITFRVRKNIHAQCIMATPSDQGVFFKKRDCHLKLGLKSVFLHPLFVHIQVAACKDADLGGADGAVNVSGLPPLPIDG